MKSKKREDGGKKIRKYKEKKFKGRGDERERDKQKGREISNKASYLHNEEK